jgi:adenine phosphoribosyltransferase
MNTQSVASSDIERRLRSAVRDVPDFPKPGILFKDITPVLADPVLLRETVEALAEPFRDARITHVVGVESRGFILAAPVAVALGAGFVPVRKPGKLPHETHSAEYALEYGTDRLEIHRDACGEDARVLVIDDVLATGGTAGATCRLVEAAGGQVVGCAFLIALDFLGGAAALADRAVIALLRY